MEISIASINPLYFGPAPIRYVLSDFTPNADQRVILRRNTQTLVQMFNTFSDCPDYKAHDDLRREWFFVRHGQRREDHCIFDRKYRFMAVQDAVTRQPLAGMAFEMHADGPGAYSFYFDTAQPGKRSLGSFTILSLITQMQMQGHAHLGFGLWHPGIARRTQYKSNFRPCDVKVNGQWARLVA